MLVLLSTEIKYFYSNIVFIEIIYYLCNILLFILTLKPVYVYKITSFYRKIKEKQYKSAKINDFSAITLLQIPYILIFFLPRVEKITVF